MSARKLLLLLLLAVTAVSVSATDDTPRRWALIGGMSISCPTVSNRSASDSRSIKATSFDSPGITVMGEYYLPSDHFSVLGGYMSETLAWYEGDLSVKMKNIALGARYYPLSRRCAIQPYASVMAYGNVGKRHDSGHISYTTQGTKRDYTVSAPFLSVAPTVGFDLYILSSVAFEVQYGYPMAVAGKTELRTVYSGSTETCSLESKMNRHNIQFALKISFPFQSSGHEVGNCLVDLIETAFGLYDPNESTKKETKSQQRKKSISRTLESY